jgi:succinyl-CoA synthetase beta subunit
VQVLAGGRGLGKFNTGYQGGVHVVESPQAAAAAAEAMLGNRLITKQTGSEGRPCNTVLVVEPLAAKMEKYFAILYDRSVGGPLVIASAKGGVTIEDIAEKDPSCIIKEPVDIVKGMSGSQALGIATKMQFGSASATKQVPFPAISKALCLFLTLKQAAETIQGLYQMFIEKDCTMVRFFSNPLKSPFLTRES